MRVCFKLEFYDGPFNGAIRYYDSLSTAIRVGKSYVTRNKDYPERIDFDIYRLTLEPYSCSKVFSSYD